MIKKTLLWLWITFLSFIGFSSALTVYNVWDAYYDWNAVLNWLNFSYNNTSKIFHLWNEQRNTIYTKFWWESDWLHYTKFNYNSRNKAYWKINWFYICSSNFLDDLGDENVFSFYLNQESACQYHDWYTDIDNYLHQGSIYFWTFNTTQNDNWSVLCYQNWTDNRLCFDLSNVTVLWNSFLSDSEINWIDNPFFNWWWGGLGWNNTNNNYLCPTVWQLLNTYSSEYNTGLCYSSSLLLQNWVVTTVEPQSIFELFENQSEFNNYRQLYWNYCSNSVSVSSDCQNAFAWKDLQYTLLAKIPWSIPSLNLYSYCNLALNQDPNTSTCVAEGVYNTGVTREDVINSIINWDYQVIVPSTWSVADDVFWSWMELNWDFINTLQSIYSKFTSFFTTQSWGWNWILPWYIISMLLVIILFKLFKK